MSDDLVKRLRANAYLAITQEAALKRGFGVTMASHDAIIDEAADRIEELEAKLAKAVEALEKIAQHDMQYWAITTLAQLKGEDRG